MQKTSEKCKKNQYTLKTKAHDLETLGSIHKKNSTLLENLLLKNCGKLSSLSPKKWRDFMPKKQQLKSTDLLPAKKHNQTLLIKQPIISRQRIKQEPHGISVETQLRQGEVSVPYFFICFEEFLSKIKSFTKGHVSETDQNASTIMKKEFTS